jgi:hypothetical protein
MLTLRFLVTLAWLRMPSRRLCRAVRYVVLAMLATAPAAAAADTVTVNTSADLAPAAGECVGAASCSLRQALDAAHSGDTVVVGELGGSPTTYTLSGGPLAVGQPVTIAGAGAALVTVSGDDASTVLDITAGPTTVSGLTIAHGAGGDATSEGGGITATGDLTLRDDVFADDVGGSGAYDGSPEDGGAGGVQSNAGVLTVLDSTFRDDSGGDGASGPDDAEQFGAQGGPGAIAALSGSVVNVTVTGSTGGDGGAGSDGTDDDDFGEPFHMPGYGGQGGAGAISGPVVLAGGLVVQSSTLAGNLAGDGGAPGAGGDNDDGGPTVPGDPGGNAVYGVELESSIAVAAQTVRTTCLFTRDGGHNLTFPAGNDCPAAVIADPLLGTLADNGGTTPTLALGTGSPAIDAAPAAACPATDQRGTARPQATGCDIGAFEVAVPPSGGGGGGGGGGTGGGGSTPPPGGGTPPPGDTGTPPATGGSETPPAADNSGSPAGTNTQTPSGTQTPKTSSKPGRVVLTTLARCRRTDRLPAIALHVPAGTVSATLERVSSTAHHGCPAGPPPVRSGRRIARVSHRFNAGLARLSVAPGQRLSPGGYILRLRGSGWSATLAFWVLH